MTELGYPTTVQEMKERYAAIAGDPAYKIFVAGYDGQVAGMAGVIRSYFFEQNGCYIRLAALVTKQIFREKGIGKMLVEAVEAWAKESSATALVLNGGNRAERAAAHRPLSETWI